MTNSDDAQLGGENLDSASLTELRARLIGGEHLAVANDYLAGRLSYERQDWRTASLVDLAMRHHLATLRRDGKLAVQLQTEQVGDGIALTVHWPQDQAIDQVDISFELVDEDGQSSQIARRFEREISSGHRPGRISGRSLASNQTVVLRPIRSAAAVKATARPSHRLRFDDRFLAPELRACRPDDDVIARQELQFVPQEISPTTAVDVYREARGRDIVEIVSMEEQRERERRARARRRRRRRKQILKMVAIASVILALIVGGLFLMHRFVAPLPEWVPIVRHGMQNGDAVTLVDVGRGSLPRLVDA